MTYLILHILGNSLGIYLSARIIKGVLFQGDIIDLLLAGLLLGILNVFVKPALKIISAPLILLTLGIFIFIINLFILWLVQYLLPEFSMSGFWAYFWTLALITAINLIINHYREA